MKLSLIKSSVLIGAVLAAGVSTSALAGPSFPHASRPHPAVSSVDGGKGRGYARKAALKEVAAKKAWFKSHQTLPVVDTYKSGKSSIDDTDWMGRLSSQNSGTRFNPCDISGACCDPIC
jgi:hypothetical protein